MKKRVGDTSMTRRSALALGSVSVLAIGCGGGDDEGERVGKVSQALTARDLLASGTVLNNPFIKFESLISASYAWYELQFWGLVSTVASNSLYLQFSSNNGGSYPSTQYEWTRAFVIPNGGGGTPAILTDANANDIGIRLAGAVSTDVCGIDGSLRLFEPLRALSKKRVIFDTTYVGPNNFCRDLGSGTYNGNTSAINAFQLKWASGNFASGAYSLYGNS